MLDAALALKEDQESENGLRSIVKLLNLCEDIQDLILVLQYRDDSQL